jgi:hypothetical protein
MFTVAGEFVTYEGRSFARSVAVGFFTWMQTRPKFASAHWTLPLPPYTPYRRAGLVAENIGYRPLTALSKLNKIPSRLPRAEA